MYTFAYCLITGLPTVPHLYKPGCNLQTNFRPPSDHAPTTPRPPSDHLPTTLRPPPDHLPTTSRPPPTTPDLPTPPEQPSTTQGHSDGNRPKTCQVRRLGLHLRKSGIELPNKELWKCNRHESQAQHEHHSGHERHVLARRPGWQHVLARQNHENQAHVVVRTAFWI